MKYYLSSYELGNKTDKLKSLTLLGEIGYIPNARDFTGADLARKAKRTANDINSLCALGLEVELVDLQDYFGKQKELKNKLEKMGAIFISGGNVFVLRQAMRLSGMDDILAELQNTNFLYAGYSAAGCVLSPSLRGMDIVDPLDTPYDDLKEVLWEGLGLIDFRFIPHWDSEHPESADVEKEILYCKENHIPFKAIRDGEVIIQE